MSAAEALRAASALADALRLAHDRGMVHAALEPCRVILNESGAYLLDGVQVNSLTPYTAPEQVAGKPADARSDIFAFGTILYEMLSGRKAFAGEGEELRAAILEREPAALAGEANGLARVAVRCLAKAPAQRWQRVQNVQMELKLLRVTARRAEQGAEPQERLLQALVRTEIAQVEERLSARMSSIEVVTAELRARQAAEGERLAAANQAAESLRGDIAALMGQVEEANQERKAGTAALAGVAGRLVDIDHTLAAHSSSIESVGTAVAQSDDLIERLVDAFDTLERSLTIPSEVRAATAALTP
jgi:hypothetical protein